MIFNFYILLNKIIIYYINLYFNNLIYIFKIKFNQKYK